MAMSPEIFKKAAQDINNVVNRAMRNIQSQSQSIDEDEDYLRRNSRPSQSQSASGSANAGNSTQAPAGNSTQAPESGQSNPPPVRRRRPPSGNPGSTDPREQNEIREEQKLEDERRATANRQSNQQRNQSTVERTGIFTNKLGGTDITIPCLDGKGPGCPPTATPMQPPPSAPPPPPASPSTPPAPPSLNKDSPQLHIGRGHLLTAKEKETGEIVLRDGTRINYRQGISREEMEKIYANDKANLSDLAKSNIDKKLGPGAYNNLAPNIRAVMDDMAFAGGNAAFKNQKLIDAIKSGDNEKIAKVVETSLTTARGDTDGKLTKGLTTAAVNRAAAIRDPSIDLEQQRRVREGERAQVYDALKPGQNPRGKDFDAVAQTRAAQQNPPVQMQQQQAPPVQQAPPMQQAPPTLTEDQKKRIQQVREQMEAAKRGEGDFKAAMEAGEKLKQELDQGLKTQEPKPVTAVPFTPTSQNTDLNNVPPTGQPTTAVPMRSVSSDANLETMLPTETAAYNEPIPRQRQEGSGLDQASLELKTQQDEKMASMTGGAPTIINNNNNNSSQLPNQGGGTDYAPINPVRNDENSFMRIQNTQALSFVT